MSPIQISADGGRQLSVLGIPMSIRVQGRDTGGMVAVMESRDMPGGGGRAGTLRHLSRSSLKAKDGIIGAPLAAQRNVQLQNGVEPIIVVGQFRKAKFRNGEAATTP